MSNWSISKRINVLTGVLLAALAVVAVIAMAAGWKSLSSFTSFKREAAAFAAVANIEAEMFKARLAAVHYRRSGETAFVDDARSRLAAIAAQEAEVVALFPQGSERRERMADIFSGARVYGEAFESLLESEAQQAEISGRLAATGAELTTIAQQAAIHPMVQATEEATRHRLPADVRSRFRAGPFRILRFRPPVRRRPRIKEPPDGDARDRSRTFGPCSGGSLVAGSGHRTIRCVRNRA